MNRRKPPSRRKYERENPVVSVRLTRELKQALDEFRAGVSYAKAIKALAKFASSFLLFSNPRNRITYPCSICEKVVQMIPNSKAHEAMRKYMKENEWAHSKCIQAEKG